jgi:hypothetical protein
METTKKARNMTERGFLHKASGKVSAVAFLAQHKAWLMTGELGELTAPILAKMEQGEILPTPCLEAISSIVLGHMVAKDAAKAENALLNPKVAKVMPWMATIYNAAGEIQTRVKEDGDIEDLQKGFEKSSDADRWVDNRLFDGAPDWYGVVAHTSIINRQGDPLSTIILRDDAIARKLKMPKGAVMKAHSQTTDKLKFGVKVKNDRAVFSKG